MAISTALPINLSDVITEMGLANPQSILTCKANVNPCGVDPTYYTNGNQLTDYRGYNHTGTVTGTVSPASATVSAVTTSYNITLSAVSPTGAAWTASDNQAWASVSPTGGNGNATITLSMSANTDPTSRVVRVTVARQCDAGTIGTSIITQSGTA